MRYSPLARTPRPKWRTAARCCTPRPRTTVTRPWSPRCWLRVRVSRPGATAARRHFIRRQPKKRIRRYLRCSLAAGANVNAREQYGETPLVFAARSNASVAVIELLLPAGADIHAQRESGGRPLHAAVRANSNPAVIEALLAAGADANASGERWFPRKRGDAIARTREPLCRRRPSRYSDDVVGRWSRSKREVG